MTMINPRVQLIQINNLISFLLSEGLAIDSNSAIIRESGPISMLTWADAPNNLFDSLIGRFASVIEYRNCIQKRLFHCMLFDGSIIQFGYVFNNNNLVKHRNCYYPCPLIITSSEIQDIQLGDDFVTLFDLLLVQEIDSLRSSISKSDFPNLRQLFRLSTPLRFDFDSDVRAENHPASHLHLLDEECRWPVFGPISVGHFVRFIFRHFYPQIWSKYEILRNWNLEFHNRSITDRDKGDLFLECLDYSHRA
jgi:hypothetical protein